MTLPAADGDKVLLITNNFPPVRGGSAVVYDNIARHSGGRLVVVAPRISYVDGLPMIGWREHDRRAQYRVIRLKLLRTVLSLRPWQGVVGKLAFRGTDLLMRLRLAAQLFRLVYAERARVVCVGELLASSWVINLFHRFTKVRTVVYVHGEEITTEDPYDREHHRARRALAAADQIIVVSRFTLEAVRTLLGPQADGKTSLIENGVDTMRFRPEPKRADLVELYGLQGQFVFVAVCRLLEKKGIDNAILGLAEVAQHYPDCRYLVVGTGPYEEVLRATAEAAGMAERVIFAGDVSDEDLVSHYCLGDVFVMPNRQLANGDTEGFGLVFLEANSCGLPVIAGRDGGSRDAVRDGENGLVVDGRSVAEIAAAMLALREDTALREGIARRGRMIAAAADWKSKAEEFMAICTG